MPPTVFLGEWQSGLMRRCPHMRVNIGRIQVSVFLTMYQEYGHGNRRFKSYFSRLALQLSGQSNRLLIDWSKVRILQEPMSGDSSIGRAEDCSRFRLLSSGRWFDSGSADFLMSLYELKKYILTHLYFFDRYFLIRCAVMNLLQRSFIFFSFSRFCSNESTN